MSVIINKSYLQPAIPVSVGGSNATSYSTNALLQAQSTGLTNLSLSNGLVVVSGGSSANQTGSAPEVVSAYQYITSVTASNVASVSFSGLSSTYLMYKIIIDALVPVTSAAVLWCLLSNDGSTYYTGSTQYGYCGNTMTSGGITAAIGASSGAAKILMDNSSGIANTASLCNNYEVTLGGHADTVTYTGIFFQGACRQGTGQKMIYGQGSLHVSTVVQGIKFQMSSGNISTGLFHLCGLLA